ncbi:hypothetical protein Q4512_10875 [Oceanihabitans sp. 2_MG-2023]|nr:hypothetical protein [Oceanihabitans sp. 2_MG-2023]
MKICTYIFTFLLTTLLLFNSTRVSLTYIYYNMDTVGFIEVFCVNKDKPELVCNGKCHLKKVAKSQNKEQKTPESIIDFKQLLLYTNTLETMVFSKKQHVKKKQINTYQNLYSFKNISDCFHPPRV